MSRSSIFNFESFEGFKPRLPKALLFAAGIVLCLEVVLRAVPDDWLFVSYTRAEFYEFMEHEVLAKYDHPQVVIFGTSHAADAIAPDDLETRLGLPPESVANLSIFGGRTNEWRDMYKNNRETFTRTKLIVIAPDEWTFSSGVADERIALYGTFSERWNYAQDTESPPHPELKSEENAKRAQEKLDAQRMKRNRLLADYFFRMRVRLSDLPMALIKSAKLGKKRTPVFDEHRMVRSDRSQIEERKEKVRDPLKYHERIHGFYKHFDTHPYYVACLEELCRMAKEDGARVLILHLPYQRTHQTEVDKLYGPEHQQHMRVSQDLAERMKTAYKAFNFPEDVQAGGMTLNDGDYVDYCHMNASGTTVMTQWLAEFIPQREKLLSK